MLRQAFADSLDLLVSPYTHERVTRSCAHRPWPLPQRSWVMAQTWRNLLFAHWAVEPEQLAAAVPPELPLDVRDGRAWIAVTPFEVRNLRVRPSLPIPLVSAFPEINVRTYVTVGGKPGIYFFSLDADSRFAVASARRLYRLPYFRARMSIDHDGTHVQRYSSHRDGDEVAPPATFEASYRPIGAPFQARPSALEHWLTERYCLYTLDDERRILRGQIHHPPWPLQEAEASISRNTMGAEVGLELDREQPLLHYAHRQDVVFWGLEPASG